MSATIARAVTIFYSRKNSTEIRDTAPLMMMNWAQLLSSSFFFCFPSVFIAKKKKEVAIIDDFRVRVCVEAGLKDGFFFFLCLNI